MAEGRNINSRRIRNVIAHDATLFVAKVSAQALNGGKHLFTGGAGGFFAGIGEGSIGSLLGLGAIGAICAAISQMDYRYALDEIKSLYRDEVAAKLGKDPEKVTTKDLDIVAKGDPERGIEGNKTLADILAKQRKQRTLGVAVSIVASIATFSILTLAMGAAGLHATGLVAMLAEGVVGVATYKMIKAPLEWVGHHRGGLHHKTTHERICQLQCDHEEGKVISQEQVLDVFVSANKNLDTMIIADYGAPLDKLSLAQKEQVVKDVGKMVPLKQLTDSINTGEYKIAELAFAVEGQVSGANHRHTLEKAGLLEGLIDKMRDKTRARENDQKEVFESSPTVSAPEPHFTERLGFGKSSTHLSHVERLKQSRATEAAAQR